MKFNIPKEFKLFGSDWKVKWDDKKLDDREAYGTCNYSTKEIHLSKVNGIDKISEDKLNQCFFHELTHTILDSIMERDLSRDEKFVNNFSELLHQFIKTAK